MKPSLFTPKERLQNYLKNSSMNQQYGIQLYGLADHNKLKKYVPSPLTIPVIKNHEDGHPQGLIFACIVNIREPTFGPWYMEGSLGILCKYNGMTGIHFVGLMLSGPGAMTGICTGRELNGLPKKLCETIHVERIGDIGHCYIERGGVRLIDVKCTMGQYNNPLLQSMTGVQEGATFQNPIDTEGSCILFKEKHDEGIFSSLDLIYYDSITRFKKWDPLTAKVSMQSSVDDPWGNLEMEEVLGGGWMISDNFVRSIKKIYSYPSEQVMDTMQYIFTGKFDQSTLEKEHQIYE